MGPQDWAQITLRQAGGQQKEENRDLVNLRIMYRESNKDAGFNYLLLTLLILKVNEKM